MARQYRRPRPRYGSSSSVGSDRPQRSVSATASAAVKGVESAAARATATVDKVSSSAERAAGATTKVASAVTAASSAVEAFGKVGIGTFAAVTAAVGASAYAAHSLAKLLTDITGIPLPVTATAMTALGAAAVYAFVPTAALTATFGALSTACGVLATSSMTAGSALLAAFTPVAVALAPIVLPLAAIAAAAYAAYKVLTDWQNIPTWLKMAVPVLYLIKFNLEAILVPVRLLIGAVKLLWDAITLPARAAAGAVRLVVGVFTAIPALVSAAVSAIPSVLSAAGSAIQATASKTWDSLKWLSGQAVSLAKSTGAAIMSAGSWLAGLPGRGFSALQGGLLGAGDMAGRAGSALSGMASRITGPITAAAVAFASYGSGIEKLSRQYEIGAGAAAVYAFASRMTGESVKDLIAVIPEGTAEFQRWQREAERFGQSGAGIQAAIQLTEAYQRSKEAVSGFWLEIGRAVAPIIADTTETIVGAVNAATKWVRENQQLIATAFRVASAVGSVGAALTVVGGVLTTAGTFLGPIVAALAAGGAALVAWRTGLAGDFWGRWGDSIKGAYGTVVSYGSQIITFAGKVTGGVTDAIRNGDLAGAVDIAWGGAKIAWMAGLQELDSMTGNQFGAILENLAAGNWENVGESLLNALRIAWLQIRNVFDDGISYLGGKWTEWQNAADEAFTGAANSADAAFVAMQTAADPWWLALTSAWRKATDEVSVWVSATVAGVQTIAGTVAGFATGFAQGIMAPFRLLPGMTTMVDMALRQVTGGASDLAKLAGTNTQDVIAANAPKSAAQAATAQEPPKPEPGQRPGEAKDDYLLRIRREARERDLAERQAGRDAASSGRGFERDAAQGMADQQFAEERRKREEQILLLQQRQDELRRQGDADAADRLAQQQRTLEENLEKQKQARAEADRNRPNNLNVQNAVANEKDRKEREKKAEEESNRTGGFSIGTFSSWGLEGMFGGAQSEPAKQTAILERIEQNSQMQIEELRRARVGFEQGPAIA